MIVRKWIDLNAPLRPEQIERLRALEDLKDEDIAFDEDCPPTTKEEGKLFRSVSDRNKVAV